MRYGLAKHFKTKWIDITMTRLSHHRGKFFPTWRKKVLDLLKRNISDVLSTSLNPSHNSHHISITVPDGQATSADDQATSNDFINGPPTFIEVTGDPPTFTGFTGNSRTSAGFAGDQHTLGEFTDGQRTAAGFAGGQWTSAWFNERQFTSTKLTGRQPLSTEFTGGQQTSTGLMNVQKPQPLLFTSQNKKYMRFALIFIFLKLICPYLLVFIIEFNNSTP